MYLIFELQEHTWFGSLYSLNRAYCVREIQENKRQASIWTEQGRLSIHDSGNTTRTGDKNKLDLTITGFRVGLGVTLTLHCIQVGCLGVLGVSGLSVAPWVWWITGWDLSAHSRSVLWDVTLGQRGVGGKGQNIEACRCYYMTTTHCADSEWRENMLGSESKPATPEHVWAEPKPPESPWTPMTKSTSHTLNIKPPILYN